MSNRNETCIDYSKQKRQFMTFGYSSPTDGMYLIDDVEYYTGEDYRTLEHYIEYKEAGLNTMMLQFYFGYEGKEPWEESLAKRMMDLCLEAGIEKCIMTDLRLHRLAGTPEPIVGPGCKFETQEDLNAYVAECMKEYADHPCFLGLLIHDEPRHWMLPAWGAVYRAIKAYRPDCYIEANLLPYMTYCQVRDFYCDHEEGVDLEEGYRRYLDKFIAASGSEKILTDDYPFLGDVQPNRVLVEHARCVQIIADYCAEHHLTFEAVAQTFAGSVNGGKTQWWGWQNMASMQWQMNFYLGFGVKTFSYFTYWRKQCNRTDGEWYWDGSSFMTQEGKKTPLYFVMQDVHKEIQDFAPVMYDFEYRHSTYIVGKDAEEDAYYFPLYQKQDLELVDASNISGDDDAILIVSELVHPETEDHMIMVMNANNPFLIEKGRDVSTDYVVDFGEEYIGAQVFHRGKGRVVALEKGVLKGHLDAGYADYIIPFRR